MSFTTLEFGVFFALFFALYWFVFQGRLRAQNLLILTASYVFYGWWDWRFLILIFVSSLVDFTVGQGMKRTDDPRKRKHLLWVSLAANLGMLGFFKYFNWFIDSFRSAFSLFAPVQGLDTLNIILPVGISFYTLQTLSYTLDVYRHKLEPTDKVIDFFAFVAFFPQLVAGPIERATHLLPQFARTREFSYAGATDGLRQVAWGLFKKMVVADNCGIYAREMLDHYEQYSAASLFLGAIVGSFQLYCDFSGYSDIAIGTARILGFDLMKNFDYPFFARTMPELWQKWHISLITWFRDYIIGFLKGFTKAKLVRNIFIIFLITGLWHGANWTYLVWGLIHALLFLPTILFRRKRYRKGVAHDRLLPTGRETFQMARTVFLFGYVGVIFLEPSLAEAYGFYRQSFTTSWLIPPVPPEPEVAFIFLLLAVEWPQRTREHGLDLTGRDIPTPLRWAGYFALIAIILLYGGSPSEFIYFQF